MGKSTFIPIDWDKDSPTYGKQLAPITTVTTPTGEATQTVGKLPAETREFVGERIYPEKIEQEETGVDFLHKVLNSDDYKFYFEDMPDRAAEVEYASKVVRGIDPVDAAREVFERRAKEGDVYRKKYKNNFVGPDGSLYIGPPNEKDEKKVRDELLKEKELDHLENMVKKFNGEL